ncbi:MAG: hypothetical protein II348_05550, partial [Clostridia bacterium]|nr:hypothetical protein [Clostridia bacterium]
MKSKISIVFFWVLIAAVIIYLAAGIVPSIFSSEAITVKAAESIVYDDVITVSGIALRDEILISAPSAPASIDYRVSDGNRVSIGDAVATYSTENSADIDHLALDTIDRQVDLLNDCISSTTQYDLKALDGRTKDSIRNHLTSSRKGNLSDSLETAAEVQSYFIKRDIKATGDKSYYRQILSNYESSRNMILTGNASKQKAVYVSQAGYFSSAYDGYEELKSSKYEAPTVESVEQLRSYT